VLIICFNPTTLKSINVCVAANSLANFAGSGAGVVVDTNAVAAAAGGNTGAGGGGVGCALEPPKIVAAKFITVAPIPVATATAGDCAGCAVVIAGGIINGVNDADVPDGGGADVPDGGGGGSGIPVGAEGADVPDGNAGGGGGGGGGSGIPVGAEGADVNAEGAAATVVNGVGVSALPLGSFPNNFINTVLSSFSPNVSLDFCNLGTVF